ncbi:MAG: hypothetical protein AB2807_09270 [Candidatus Sedimenticola endophacoides]
MKKMILVALFLASTSVQAEFLTPRELYLRGTSPYESIRDVAYFENSKDSACYLYHYSYEGYYSYEVFCGYWHGGWPPDFYYSWSDYMQNLDDLSFHVSDYIGLPGPDHWNRLEIINDQIVVFSDTRKVTIEKSTYESPGLKIGEPQPYYGQHRWEPVAFEDVTGDGVTDVIMHRKDTGSNARIQLRSA